MENPLKYLVGGRNVIVKKSLLIGLIEFLFLPLDKRSVVLGTYSVYLTKYKPTTIKGIFANFLHRKFLRFDVMSFLTDYMKCIYHKYYYDS